MIQKMQKKLLHQPLHPNGLPTGMHVQRFLRVSSLFEHGKNVAIRRHYAHLLDNANDETIL